MIGLLLFLFFTQSVQCGNLGIGFSTGGPFDVPLAQMRDKKVFLLKNWDIQPDLLDQMEITYAQDSLDVTVAVPNYRLADAANNDQTYLNFVRDQLIKHRRIIKLVAVVNEPFLQENRAGAMPYILNAFNRIVKLLADNGLSNDIKVTIPFSGVVLVNTYPVENSVFHPDVIDLMRAVTPTLISTGSKFSINVYPYFDYAYSTDIPLDFALGRSGSLLEAKLRGCRLALDKIGANAVPIIVGETGWPSAGGKDTNIDNMKAYTEHVLNFVRNSQLAQAIYIFEAYDEAWKQGSEVERHWGLYYEGTRVPKFQFDISSYGPRGTGSVNWNGNDWALYCDFTGQDLSNARTTSALCGSQCLQTSGCTHYTWTSYNSGTCWMKSGPVKKSDAISVSKTDYVCGINPIAWTVNNEATACDFPGKDISNVVLAKSICATKCQQTTGCTHYSWTTFNGGTCWLKSGSTTKFDALYNGDFSTMCGFRGVNWTGNWAFSCDFAGGDLSNAVVPGSQCSTKCSQTPGCTHFTWTNYNGGTCWMKKGAVTKANAYFVNDPAIVCGLL